MIESDNDSCRMAFQWLLLTQKLIDSWNGLLMGSVKGSHLSLFALIRALLLPIPVNSSTLYELGAEEHRQDERDIGGERDGWES